MSDENVTSNNGKVTCLECQKEFIFITAAHLKKSHTLTVEGYKLRYPGAQLAGEIFKAKQRNKKKKIFNNDSDDIIKNNEVNIRELAQKKINDIHQEILKENDIPQDNQYIGFREDDNQKDDTPEDDNFINYDIHKENNINENIETLTVKKQTIIEFLIKNGFENIEDNFLIRKVSILGTIEYEFISDMSDPIKKVDFEFPKTFWHNQDKFLNFKRDKILKDDGWKIIKINQNPISLKHLLNEIEQNLNII